MSGKQKDSSDLAVGLSAYYNEFDNYAAEWLRNLIAEGLIADGDVDNRPIQEVTPNDLQGYTQAHFFAGIGGWSYALRLAGWPDERPVWTGSCPCQSYSVAGKREGASDSERHLFPDWFRLIEKCQPPTVFGEQVAGAIGFGWLDAVATDFESQDYAFASSVLSGFTVGAHHNRQRLWFVADSNRTVGGCGRLEKQQERRSVGQCVENSGIDLADPYSVGQKRNECESVAERYRKKESARGRASQWKEVDWSEVEWVECHDKKTRPIPLKSGLQPLVNGLPTIVDREGNTHNYSYSKALQGIGNAIIPQVGAEFIRAYCEVASRQ